MESDRNTSTAQPIIITGRKEELDSANLWAWAVCVSVYGPTQGESFYRTVPALPVLLMHRFLVDTGGVH